MYPFGTRHSRRNRAAATPTPTRSAPRGPPPQCSLPPFPSSIYPNDYVFTDPAGQPPSQEWLHKRVWLVALERAGLRRRGQYNFRDSFITIALSAGEDPGWVAKGCGTSEEMIFPALPHLDPGPDPRRGGEGQPYPQWGRRGASVRVRVPRGVPSAEIDGRNAAKTPP
jgi:hypothetical protein